MPAGVIARLVGAGLFILAILGGALYFSHLGAKLEKQQVLLQQQQQDLKIRAENEKKLTEAIEEQTDATRAARAAAQVANALYEEELNRPRPIHTVPRDRVVEVVRSGDCDRAALDAWDLLKEKGVIQWNDASNSRGSDYWRDYYLDYARHARPPQPVQVDFLVQRPLSSINTPLKSQFPGLSSRPCPLLSSGLQVSAEIQWPQTPQ